MAEPAYTFKAFLNNLSGPRAGGDYVVQFGVIGEDIKKLKTIPTLTQDKQLGVLVKDVMSDEGLRISFHAQYKGLIKRLARAGAKDEMQHFLSFSVPGQDVSRIEELWTVEKSDIFEVGILVGGEIEKQVREAKKNRVAKVYAQMREIADLKDVSIDTIKGKIKDKLALDSFSHIAEDDKVALEGELQTTINNLKKNVKKNV